MIDGDHALSIFLGQISSLITFMLSIRYITLTSKISITRYTPNECQRWSLITTKGTIQLQYCNFSIFCNFKQLFIFPTTCRNYIFASCLSFIMYQTTKSRYHLISRLVNLQHFVPRNSAQTSTNLAENSSANHATQLLSTPVHKSAILGREPAYCCPT